MQATQVPLITEFHQARWQTAQLILMLLLLEHQAPLQQTMKILPGQTARQLEAMPHITGVLKTTTAQKLQAGQVWEILY